MRTSRGARFPTHTPLGQIMWEDNLTVREVALQTGIHPRIMTEYLSGRLPITAGHMAKLTDMLDMDPEELTYNGPAKYTRADMVHLNEN